MKVKASDLADALKSAKPHPLKKRPKPLLVSLEHELVAGTLAVIEAKHGAFAKSVPASGEWPGAPSRSMVSCFTDWWRRGHRRQNLN